MKYLLYLLYLYGSLYGVFILILLDNQSNDDSIKYYLKVNQRTVFIAKLENSAETNTIHFKNIPQSCGKFLIMTMSAQRALAWPHYDADVHCCRIYVIWKLSQTQK